MEVRIKNLESATSTPLAYVISEIPAIEGFGPVTGGLGMKNEFIVRDSLIDSSVLLVYLMLKHIKTLINCQIRPLGPSSIGGYGSELIIKS